MPEHKLRLWIKVQSSTRRERSKVKELTVDRGSKDQMSTVTEAVSAEVEKASEHTDQTREQHVLLMENQSNVLDEVDQLVELMTTEKNTLTEKISTLETELSKAVAERSLLEESNHQLQRDCDVAKLQVEQLEVKYKHECAGLKEALKRTHNELKQTRHKLDSLSSSFSHKAQEFTKLSGQRGELKQKLRQLTEQYKDAQTALEVQCKENVKLSECCKNLTSENATLNSRLESTQQRSRHSQDEVLALKGRLTMAKKAQEQLQEKNSGLEKALESANSRSPTIVKVSTRSREELRLAADCRRKDELLARYAEEFSKSQSEKHIFQQTIQKTKKALHTQREETKSLQAALETNKNGFKTTQDSLQEELQQCKDKLEAKSKEMDNFSSTKQELESQLLGIQGELGEARKELSEVRREVEEREKRSDKEVNKLVKEKAQLAKLIKSSREMIEALSKELESVKMRHNEEVKELKRESEKRLKESREDYRRMKEASTKRCTELAKEVWTLRSKLPAAGDSTETHTPL